jgi:hypothetical protein
VGLIARVFLASFFGVRGWRATKRRHQGRQGRDNDEEDPNPAEQKKGRTTRKNYLGKEAANALEKVSDLCPLAPLSYTRMNMSDTHLTRHGAVTLIFFPVSVAVMWRNRCAAHC